MSLEKAISIGLKSGLCGRKRISAPAPSMACRTATGLWAAGCPSDDVTGGQCWHQHVLHIGQEGRAVHGAVEHHGRGHAVQPKRADEGGGLPMTMGHRGTAPLAAPAIAPRHFGRGAGFVDDDQSLRLQVRLGSNQARRRRTTSGRCCSLACAVFFEHPATLEQAPDRALRDHHTVGRGEMLGQLRQGGPASPSIRARISSPWASTGRAVIAAPRPRPDIAGPSPPIDPFDRRRSRHPRCAAERRVIPPSTAATSRSRRSLERDFAMLAGLLLQHAS